MFACAFVSGRRTALAALAALALGSGALAETRPPSGSPADPLVKLNTTFRAAYKDLRAWAIAKSDPVIVVQFDVLHLVRHGKVQSENFTPPIYHEYKAIAHIPLALYVALARYPERKLDEQSISWLKAYREQVKAGAESLAGRPGWTPAMLGLHGKIVDASLKLIDTVLAAGLYHENQLTAYTRAMRPLVMASADAAARAQLDGLHALVTRWRKELGPHWSHVDVVVLGPKQPRAGNLQYQYFKRVLGPGAEGRRLWYAEGIFDLQGGLNLFGTLLIDRGASIAFFNDPVRLERDLLSDATARYLNHLFPRRR